MLVFGLVILSCPVVQVVKTDDGLEAIVFTAQGDMRQVQCISVHCWYTYVRCSG